MLRVITVTGLAGGLFASAEPVIARAPSSPSEHPSAISRRLVILIRPSRTLPWFLHPRLGNPCCPLPTRSPWSLGSDGRWFGRRRVGPSRSPRVLRRRGVAGLGRRRGGSRDVIASVTST